MLNLFLLVIRSAAILILAVLLHEFGHWLYFKYELHKNIKVHWSWDKIIVGSAIDYHRLSSKQKFFIYYIGVILGIIPILLLIIYNLFSGFIVFCLYLWACSSDIKNMWRFRYL